MNPERLARRHLRRGTLDLVYHDAVAGTLPVVLQHGLGGSAQQTAEAFPDDPRLRLLTLECRGHGDSPAGDAEALSIATFADDVAALIEAEHLAPAIVGGISMGAAIALRLAVRRPELVRALVLVRPAWLCERAPANMQPNAEVGALLKSHATDHGRALFEQGATARRLAAEAPDNLASLRGFFTREPIEVTAELLCRISADGPGIDAAELDELDLPALVIGNEADAVHPIDMARRLAQALPRGEFIEVTPKSHSRAAYVHDLHAALAAFIAKVSP